MGRRAKLNWEVYKDQLITLKYGEGKSLTEINKILFTKLGFCFTNARLSQKFTEWSREQEVKPPVIMAEESISAN